MFLIRSVERKENGGRVVSPLPRRGRLIYAHSNKGNYVLQDRRY